MRCSCLSGNTGPALHPLKTFKGVWVFAQLACVCFVDLEQAFDRVLRLPEYIEPVVAGSSSRESLVCAASKKSDSSSVGFGLCCSAHNIYGQKF